MKFSIVVVFLTFISIAHLSKADTGLVFSEEFFCDGSSSSFFQKTLTIRAVKDLPNNNEVIEVSIEDASFNNFFTKMKRSIQFKNGSSVVGLSKMILRIPKSRVRPIEANFAGELSDLLVFNEAVTGEKLPYVGQLITNTGEVLAEFLGAMNLSTTLNTVDAAISNRRQILRNLVFNFRGSYGFLFPPGSLLMPDSEPDHSLAIGDFGFTKSFNEKFEVIIGGQIRDGGNIPEKVKSSCKKDPKEISETLEF